MCGIAGILHLDGAPASPAILQRMTDAIAHRGPDGEGAYVDGPLGLGHRRLAIIDVSPAGHQPMISADHQTVLSYNGETFNFQELRAELEAEGCRFRSRTDSEVVLYALERWGTRALSRFNGMFAIAAWDKRTRKLLLARDRYGIKPLYYTVQGDTVLFGSEIKAILQHPAYRTSMDREALVEYFTFQNFFTDRTLFTGVRLLPAGTFVELTVGDLTPPRIQTYWDFRFEEPAQPASEAEYIEELDRLFRQAVSRQLVSDVDLGAYLSGGMDSGSITAIAAKQLPNLRTFTCGFDLHSASGLEQGFDERAKAEWMSYLFKTEQYEIVLKAGDMERCLSQLAWHIEEPRVGQSYPNFYISQLASRFVKVVLSGAGGDELFGGYPWRYYRAVVNDDFEHYVDQYFAFWQRLVPGDATQALFAPIWGDVSHVSTRDIFKQVFRGHQVEPRTPEQYVNQSLYFEAKTFLNGLLVMEDKLSMAHGLETRVPFLDNDLVDFAMRLPVRMKLGNLGEVVRLNENEPGNKSGKYFQKTRDGKLIVRKLMRRYLPAELADGEKQGFSAPDASWFRGESMDYVRRALFDPKARIYDFLDPKPVQAWVTEHLDGKVNRRLLIWSLLSVEQWCRRFL